jgi:hypothetical protein
VGDVLQVYKTPEEDLPTAPLGVQKAPGVTIGIAVGVDEAVTVAVGVGVGIELVDELGNGVGVGVGL